MKAFKNGLLLLSGIFFFLSSPGFSQEYTLRDQEEIAYQAQLTLNMYEDLLNVISYADLATESEIQELIRNSYTPSRSQLFYSPKAIIEDNSKPSSLEAGHKQDKTIKDYLHHFDLAYEKAAQETIEFYDFEVSNLKYSTYPYIKIKYTCLFKGKHKEDPAAYKAVERVAEFRVEKRDNKWKTFISSILFYDPQNPIHSGGQDVVLNEAGAEEETFSYLSGKINNENGNSSEESKEAPKQPKEQDSVFYYHLEQGKVALAAEELDRAFQAFSAAEKINPYHQGLRQKLMELAKAQNLMISSKEERFAHAMRKAEKAYAARAYSQAKRHYLRALELKPGEEQLKVKLEKLDSIIQRLALLESKYSIGAYKEAVKGYSKAIRENPKNADYFYGRGKSNEKLNEEKKAIKDYSRAIELDGDFIQALSSRARLYTKTAQYSRAIADYSLILSDPDNAAAFYPERAQVKKKMGDFRGALEDINAAIQLQPKVARHHFEKGMLLISMKNHKEAVQAFTVAIERDPQQAASFYQRGMVYAALDKLNAASTDFKRARELGLEEAQLARVEKMALSYYTRGEEAMAEKKYEEAIESFTKALLLSPAFGRSWLRKGDAYYALEEYEEAISNYNNAVKFSPNSFAYFRRGRAYQQMQEEASAIHDFKSYIPIGKELVERAGEKRSKKSSPSEKNFALEEAEAWYTLGYAQLMTSQFSEAVESLDKAIRSRKFFPEAFFARGSAHYALEDYKRAVKDMENSIKMGFSQPIVFFSLGKAYVANNQLKEAVFSFTHLIELDPQYKAAYRERALCYKRYEQYALALEDVDKALSLNEDEKEEVALKAQKGLLQLYLNRLPEAKASFDQALRMDGNNGWALYGKACALAQEQKTEEALELYRKAFRSSQFSWPSIRKDPLLKPIRRQRAFRELVKDYL